MKKKRKPIIQKLEKAIRAYILKRDQGLCQKCWKEVEGCNAHVSHVIPKSHGNVLRFDEWNLKLLCFHCHINWWHKNPIEAGEWFKGQFLTRYEYLQERKEQIVKLSEDDLLELIDMYKGKFENLC